MQFTILSVGKLKNDVLPRVEAYSKRLAVYCRMNIVEIPEGACKESMSSSEIEQVRLSEGRIILAQVKQEQYVIALTGEGELWTPKRLSVQVEDLQRKGETRFSLSLVAHLVYQKKYWSGQMSGWHSQRRRIRIS